jgi:hypothetical protein
MDFKQLKGEPRVRHDGGMTPDQTITDGAEPNSKLTAKMSAPGQSEVGGRNREVRFNPESRLNSDIAPCPKSAPIGDIIIK